MRVLSKKTAISLACAAALGGLTASPTVAGIIAPTDKETVSSESPLDFVGWRRICHYHCHWAWRPRRGCVVATDYRPVHHYGWCRHYYSDFYVLSPAYVVTYPYYPAAGWGLGWIWPFSWL
jgi:hypothetical protein